MQTTDQSSLLTNGVITVNGFTAARIDDALAWGEGAIQPQAAYPSDDDQQTLLETVLQSIEPVAEAEQAYSACTDGRIPVKLLNGEAIPVREQMVGADMVSAFYVAEVLGDSFYKDPNAPVAERVHEVAQFLQENGLRPSSHVGCGAATGFVAILQNIVRFAQDPRFIGRLRALVPGNLFDDHTPATVSQQLTRCLDAGRYDGLEAQTFLDAVEAISGQRAIAELKDDNRGVHGHVEEAIVRLRTPGHAINEAKVAAQTNGREVFGVNDTRMEKIARLFGRGTDSDYQKAYVALEMFADAGHGTLAKDLPTWIVTSE